MQLARKVAQLLLHFLEIHPELIRTIAGIKPALAVGTVPFRRDRPQITEAFGWETAPRHIIRDRDRVYGKIFTRRLRAMGIRDRPIASRSPWQNGHAERLIDSIRRECLDHVVVFGERHLRHMLLSYMAYYNKARTHLSLNKDAPLSRPVHVVGSIHANPILGGLHHHYVRI
jgi:transposase InsO family protein